MLLLGELPMVAGQVGKRASFIFLTALKLEVSFAAVLISVGPTKNGCEGDYKARKSTGKTDICKICIVLGENTDLFLVGLIEEFRFMKLFEV
jgi:hypothetical protein